MEERNDKARYQNNENALKPGTHHEDVSSHVDTIPTNLMSKFEANPELINSSDQNDENVLKLDNHHEDAPYHVDFNQISLINNAMGNIIPGDESVSDAQQLVPSTTVSNLELEESHFSKYRSEDIEIIGLGLEAIKDGIEVGIRIKGNNDNAIYRLDSREVTRLWPQLYISYLEHHVVFF